MPRIFSNYRFISDVARKPSLLVVIFAVCFAFWQIDLWRPYNSAKGESNFVWDIFGYYSYLPAYFCNDGSFDWKGEMPGFLPLSPTGQFFSKYTYGMSILYAPFFALGYKIAINQQDPLNGFSEPFATCIGWGSIFYVLVGMVFLRRFLLHYFSEAITALTLFLVLFGTMLFLYTYIQGESAHGYLFFLFAVFLFATKNWHDRPTWGYTVLIALSGGLAALIRPTEIYLFFLFMLWNVRSWQEFKLKIRFFLSEWPKLIVIILIGVLLWVPQLLYWKAYAGQYFFFSYQGESFFWDDPQVLNILFSFRKGWLVYTPLVAAALVGFFMVPRSFPLSRYTFLFITLLTVYVFSCWWDWNYGGCFGAREFCAQIAYLSVPLAFFLRFVFSSGTRFLFKGWVSLLSVFFLFSCVWLNIGQSYQYQNLRMIHPWAMSKKSYEDVFLKYQFREEAKNEFWRHLEFPDHDNWKKGIGRDDKKPLSNTK